MEFAEQIDLDGFLLDKNSRPFLVGELSGNHNNDLERAKKLIDAAKEAKVDAIKLQTYSADTITIKSDLDDFRVKGGIWAGYQLYDLYQEASLPFEWHKELFEYAKSEKITIFSSPFDTTSVDLLESLNIPFYKIASPEIIDLQLIEYVARKRKPIMISTGMASLEEINDALQVCLDCKNNSIILLHCISSYPSNLSQSYLANIEILKKKFGTLVGISDHSLDNLSACISVAMGAKVVEKHFTLSRKDGGVDSKFSLEKEELKFLSSSLKDTFNSINRSKFGPKEEEVENYRNRRSLFLVNDKKRGDRINAKDIKSIRPATGLKPKFFKSIIGKKVKEDLRSGTPINMDMFIND